MHDPQTFLASALRDAPALQAAAARIGLDTERARQLAAVLARLGGAAAGERLSITEVKRNPGSVLAEVVGGAPRRLADGKRSAAPEAMLVSTADLAVLVEGILQAGRDRRVTGEEVFARLAHKGAPSAISLAPPPEDAYDAPAAGLARRSGPA